MSPETRRFFFLVWATTVTIAVLALAVCDRVAWVRLSVHDAMLGVDTHHETPFQRLYNE